MHFSKNFMRCAAVAARIKLSLLIGLSALALTACVVDGGGEPALDTETEAIGTEASALGVACVFGDGYSLASGSNVTIYPVSCGSDCNDFPNGGLDLALFCVNGVLGESNPALTGGSVAPVVNASQFNGYSRCTAKPTSSYAQSADRKTCIRR